MQLDSEVSRSRYLLKKLARRLVAESSAVVSGSARDPCIRVFTYHRFGEPGRDPFCVRPEVFDDQLRWLTRHVDVLTPERFAAIQSGTEALRRNAALITIDDGHRSALTRALPVLERYAIHAVFFVCPALVDGVSRAPGRGHSDFLDWHELARISALGHEIGSHGDTHRSLGRLALEEAEREIARAKARLQERLGSHSPFFAFPFGRRRDYSGNLLQMLGHYGYSYCFSAVHGACRPGARPGVLPRVKVESGEGLRMFKHIARGHMDFWSHVDTLALP